MADYRLADIAKSIRNIVQYETQLGSRLTKLEDMTTSEAEQAAASLSAPPIPYGGQSSLLSPFIFYATRVTSVSTACFYGLRQCPTGNDSNPYQDDSGMSARPIKVSFDSPSSAPEVDDIVMSHFLGCYGTSFSPVYGFFDRGSSQRCNATLYADLESTDSTGAVDNIVGIDGARSPVSSLSSTLTAWNVLEYSGDAGYPCKIEKNGDRWEIYAIKPHTSSSSTVPITFVTTLRVDGDNIQAKTQTAEVLAAGEISNWSTWHEGTVCST